MDQEKFLKIGDYITAGDIDTAARLISELIDDGLSPLSFKASAVLSIISYHVGNDEQARDFGLTAINTLDDNIDCHQEITHGITIFNLLQSVENTCYTLGDYSTEKILLDKMAKHTKHLPAAVVTRAIVCEQQLSGIEAAVKYANQYSNISYEDDKGIYNALKKGMAIAYYNEASKHCGQSGEIPDGPLELLRQLANYILAMIESAECIHAESDADTDIQNNGITLGKTLLIRLVPQLLMLGGKEEVFKNKEFPAAKEFFRCNEKLTSLGVQISYYALGRLYAEGIGTEKNEHKAFQCMSKAAETGDTGSLIYLAFFYRDGIGTKVDYKKAFECIQQPANSGHPGAEALLGELYVDGNGTEKDTDKGISLLQKALNAGIESAKDVLLRKAREDIENYDEKIDFLVYFSDKTIKDREAASQDIDGGQKYLQIYKEAEKYYISPFHRKCFLGFCLAAQPEVVNAYNDMVSAEYFIEQFDKAVQEEGDHSLKFAVSVVNCNLIGKADYELIMALAKNKAIEINWRKIQKHVSECALRLGWDGVYADGSRYSPEDERAPKQTVQAESQLTSSASSPKGSDTSQHNNTSTQESGGGCYVATAVYGSYDCPEVWTLRRFRDFQLEKSWHGRIFIKIYYAISPILVKHFGAKHWFQRFWKGKLDRLIANLKANGFDDTPYCD